MKAAAHRLVVPRTARYLTLGDIEAEIAEVWFLCHGYGQLAAPFLESARVLQSPRRLLVAPEALSRFYYDDHETVGASWMTREEREQEIEDYVRYLDLVHDKIFELIARPSVRLVVLGFSQGVATAARWAVRGQATVEHLVLWGSAVPPELDASIAPLHEMRLTLVSGTRDEIFRESAREEQRVRLRRLGIAFSEASFEGGHRLDDGTLRRVAG